MMRKAGWTHVVTMLLIVVLVLAGFGKNTAIASSEKGSPRTSLVDTRVMVYAANEAEKSVDKMSPALASIIAIFAKGVLDKGFDLLGVALDTAAGKKATADVTVEGGGMQYALVEDGNLSAVDLNDFGDTIAIVRGTFSKLPGKGGVGGAMQTTVREKFNSSAESFIFVARMEYSKDKSAFRLVPQYIFYDGGIAGKKKIDVATHFTFRLPAKPDPKDESKAYGAATLVFKGLEKTTVLDEEALQGKATVWMPLPVLESSTKTLSHTRIPFDVEVRLVETKDANALLKLMADAFEAKKDELKKEVTATINIDTN